jgi:DNA-directed RNA polymerase specialized sigma24 family protein
MTAPKRRRAIYRYATERDAAYAAARDAAAASLLPDYNQRRIARNQQIANIGAEIQQLTLKMSTINEEIDAAEEAGDEDLMEQLLDDLEYVQQQRYNAEADREQLIEQETQESASESHLLKRKIASRAAAEVEQRIAPRRGAPAASGIPADFKLALVEAAADQPNVQGKCLAHRSDFAELLGLVRSDNAQHREFAWLLLIAEVYRPLLKTCKNILRGSNEEAEELTIATLGVAYPKIGQYRGVSEGDAFWPFIGWLKQIAINERQQDVRGTKETLLRGAIATEDGEAPASPLDSLVADEGSTLGISPLASYEGAEFVENLQAGLRAVSRKLKDGKKKTDIFLRHYIDGVSQADIAEEEGIARPTVNKYVQQVMKSLVKAYPELALEAERLEKTAKRTAGKAAKFEADVEQAEAAARSRKQRVEPITYDPNMSPLGNLRSPRRRMSNPAARSRRTNPAALLPAFIQRYLDSLRGRF